MTFETFSIIWVLAAIVLAVLVIIAMGALEAEGRQLSLLCAIAAFLLVSGIVIGTIGGETKDNGERREIEALGYDVVEVDTLFHYVVIDHAGRYLSCDYNEAGGRFFVEPLHKCRAADYGPKVEAGDE